MLASQPNSRREIVRVTPDQALGVQRQLEIDPIDFSPSPDPKHSPLSHGLSHFYHTGDVSLLGPYTRDVLSGRVGEGVVGTGKLILINDLSSSMHEARGIFPNEFSRKLLNFIGTRQLSGRVELLQLGINREISVFHPQLEEGLADIRDIHTFTTTELRYPEEHGSILKQGSRLSDGLTVAAAAAALTKRVQNPDSKIPPRPVVLLMTTDGRNIHPDRHGNDARSEWRTASESRARDYITQARQLGVIIRLMGFIQERDFEDTQRFCTAVGLMPGEILLNRCDPSQPQTVVEAVKQVGDSAVRCLDETFCGAHRAAPRNRRRPPGLPQLE